MCMNCLKRKLRVAQLIAALDGVVTISDKIAAEGESTTLLQEKSHAVKQLVSLDAIHLGELLDVYAYQRSIIEDLQKDLAAMRDANEYLSAELTAVKSAPKPVVKVEQDDTAKIRLLETVANTVANSQARLEEALNSMIREEKNRANANKPTRTPAHV